MQSRSQAAVSCKEYHGVNFNKIFTGNAVFINLRDATIRHRVTAVECFVYFVLGSSSPKRDILQDLIQSQLTASLSFLSQLLHILGPK
jgi:hypothetical protein